MQNESLKFAEPIWILVGVGVCMAIMALHLRFDRRRDADLAKWMHPRFRARLTEGFSPKLRILKRALWLLAILLCFAAIARPQMGSEMREVKRKGIDILFAVDTSRSMLADDLKPNRLERARLGIIDFVNRLEGDRVGLIPFAGSAFALCPLTLDYDAFRESLEALDTDLIPRQGTDLASAIKEAERLFDENANNYRTLILLTDGEDLQGSVIDAAKEAHKKGMSIYTVGVGSAEGSTIPIRLRNGRMDTVRDESGAAVITALDETTLKKIAEATGALYVPLGRGAEGLDKLYLERLRLVPKSELNQRLERIPLERFEWPLGIALVLLFTEFFISDRLRLKRTDSTVSVARRTTLAAWLPFSLLVITATHSDAEDPRQIYNKGTLAYSQGDFPKATEALRLALKTEDLSLQQKTYYNLGNSLYRTGQGTLEKDPKTTIKTWEQSVKAYQDTLALNPQDSDANYNKTLVEKKLEDLKKQQDQKNPKNEKEKKEKEEKKEKKDSDEKQKSEEQKNAEKEDGKEDKDKKEDAKSEEQKEKEAKEKKEGKEGETKDGANEGEKKEEGNVSNERPGKDEMTPEEARQMLESLRGDERTVIPIPRRTGKAKDDNTTKGKTW